MICLLSFAGEGSSDADKEFIDIHGVEKLETFKKTRL
jgi:hypothetical protein